MKADIIIVGGGTAGSVMASRLSEDPGVSVLVIEAGPSDGHPLIRIPKGMSKLLSNPAYTYYYPTRVEGTNLKPEVMLRGRMLGGSSGINGMVYHRGQPADYDRWAELGLAGWGWADMQRCFVALENHMLPETEWRGRGGPIPLRVLRNLPRLSRALIDAAAANGVPFKEDPNLLEQIGVGPVAENIDAGGERVSAARGFLTPEVRKRPNLTIRTDLLVERILFDAAKRARGVLCRAKDGSPEEHHAEREVILSAGTIESPRLLQLSGVGPSAVLTRLGIAPVHVAEGVGRNYRDHYSNHSQWRLKHERDSDNRDLRGVRQGISALRWMLMRQGPLAYGSHRISMFADVASGTGRADAEFLFAPYSLDQKPGIDKIKMEDEPGAHFFSFPLRGTSEGTLEAASRDIADPPIIRPQYLGTEYDRTVMVATVRFLRRVMGHPALSPYVVGEIGEGAAAQSDEEIIEATLRFGSSAYHSIGTCRMGSRADESAVVDADLKVRGVDGLRIVDCSIMPEQVSANTMAPVMAIAWRASEIIRASGKI